MNICSSNTQSLCTRAAILSCQIMVANAYINCISWPYNATTRKRRQWYYFVQCCVHVTLWPVIRLLQWRIEHMTKRSSYTGCPRRNGQNFGRVFLMLNYTDITQNTCIQSWTVMGIMTIEKCGLLGGPRTVHRPWRHTHPLRMPGSQTPLANVAMQWPWRDYASAAACVKCLVTLRTTMMWVWVFL